MRDTSHHYDIVYRMDGVYVDLMVLRDDIWVTVTQWLIPGTELKD